MNERVLTVVKKMLANGIIIGICFILFQVGEHKGRFGLETKTYEWNSLYEEPPSEYLEVAASMTNIIRSIWVILGMLAAYHTINYMLNPDSYKLKRWKNAPQV